MKKIILILISIITFSINIAAQPTIRYVSNSGVDTLINGSSGNPYNTVQYAINQSNLHDTIILLPGIYYQSLQINSTKNLIIASQFILNHDTTYISNTIIDGSQFYGPGALVTTSTGNDSTLIKGLTFRNSNTLITYYTMAFSYCIFFNNGNASSNMITSELVEYCKFYNNHGWTIVSSTITRNSYFKNNGQGQSNGSVASPRGNATVSRCYFENNNNNCIEGGYNNSIDYIINIAFNTIINNNFTAISIYNYCCGQTFILTNNIIENNQPNIAYIGGGYSIIKFKRNYIKPYIDYTPSLLNFNIQHIDTDTTGFSGLDSITPEGFRALNSSSKLIGAATNTFSSTPDFLGNSAPMPVGSNYDMGAIESPYAFPAPILDQIIGGDTQIRLTWHVNAISQITKYRIYRSLVHIPDTSTLGIIVDTLSVNTLTYLNTGLTNLTKYYYRIQSGDNQNNWSAMSNELSCTPNIPSSIPTLIIAERGPRKSYLKWSNSLSVNSSVKYNVYRSLNNSNFEIINSNMSDTSLIDTALIVGGSYNYKIAAIDTFGSLSSYSNVLNVVPNRIWYISPQGSDSINFGGIYAPMQLVNSVVSLCENGDTVLMLNGIHYQRVNLSTKGVFLTSNFIFSNNDSDITNTILDASSNGNVITVNNNNSKLVGFTIQNGYSAQGAGVYSGQIELRNLIIKNCIANGDICGAGAYISGKALIANCKFYNNTGRKGGALCIGGGVTDTIKIINCIFKENYGWEQGSALLLFGALVELSNSIFYKNYGSQVLYFYGSAIHSFKHCNFIDNASPALFNQEGVVNIKNSIIRDITSTEITSTINPSSTYTHITNSNIKGGFPGIGNFDLNPQFVDTNVMLLKNNSPCIGRGNSSTNLLFDYFNNSRPNPSGTNPDVGAYESPFAIPSPDLNQIISGSNNIQLKWSANASLQITKFRIFRSLLSISDSATQGIIVDTLSVNTLTYLNTGLTNLTKYYYRIQSGDNQNNWSAMSNELSCTPNIPSSIPTLIIAERGPRKSYLKWSNSLSVNSSVKYNVYRSLNNSNFEIINSNIIDTSLIDTALIAGGSYNYKIAAIDTFASVSGFSNVLNVVPNRIWYVNTQGNDSINFGGISVPVQTVNLVILSCNNGDTIILLPGIYYQQINTGTKSMVISSLFLLTQDTSYIGNTIVDGSQFYNPIPLIETGLTASFKLSGITLRNAIASALVTNSSNNIIVSNVRFLGNSSNVVFTSIGPTVINNCDFFNNPCNIVVVSISTNSIIKNCFFKNNGSSSGQDVIYNSHYQNLDVTRCYFEGNNMPCLGGGCNSNVNSVFKIYNNTIVNNNSAAFDFRNCDGGMTFKIYNNIVLNNQFAFQYWNAGYSIIEFKNNFIKPINSSVSPSFLHFSIQNINTDSIGYCGLDSLTSNGILCLNSSSKLIGAGINTFSSPIDLLGNPAPMPSGFNYDLGAIESSLGLPIIKADSIPSFCANDNPATLQFVNPKGGVYSGPGMSNGTIFSPNTLVAGLYNIKYTFTNANAAVIQDSFNITVKPIPVNIIVSDSIASCGDSLLVSATPSLSSYLWSNGKITPTIYAKTTGLYQITVYNNLGCSNKDSVYIFMNKHTVDAGSNIIKNCGDSITLSPTTNYTKSQSNLTWSWNPAIGLNSAFVKNPIAKPIATTIYTLTLTSTEGCVATDTIKITINPLTVDAGINASVVCGDSLQINANPNFSNGAFSYSWVPNNGLNNINIKNPKTAPFNSTIYTVTLHSINGCGNPTDSLLITVNPLVVEAGANKSIICGGTAQLNNVVTNYSGSGVLKYYWSPSTGLNNDSIINPTATVTQNTKYYVTVIAPNGCSGFDSITVTVNPFIVDAGTDKAIVCGSSVLLNNITTNYTGTGTLTYLWSPNTGLNNVNIQSPTSSANGYIKYTLNVSTPNGCLATDTVKVNVTPLSAEAGLNKTIICGGSTLLNNIITNYIGGGTLHYNWLPSTGLNNDTLINPTATITQTTKYYVTVTTPNGCTAIDSITVIVNPFIADAGTDKTIVCGAIAQLNTVTSNYTGIGTLSYSWSPTLGLNSLTISNPTANILQTTKYFVTVTTPNACISTDSINVIVNPLSAEAGIDKTIICGGTAQLNNVTTNFTGTGTLSYAWTPTSGLSSFTVFNPLATVIQNTKYYVAVTTPNGCIANDSISVFVNPLTAEAGIDKTIICGGTTQLNSVTSNYTGTGTLTYAWMPTTGLSSINISNPTSTITQTNKYFVTVSTPNGCSAIDSINVIVNPLTAEAGVNKTIICGGTAQLNSVTTNYTGTGSLTYSWSPTIGLNSISVLNPTATVIQTTKYYVTTTTPNGCAATDSINVIVNPLTVNAGSDKTIICGAIAQLDNATSNYTGTATLTYSWTPTTGLNNATIPNPTTITNSNITYHLTIHTPNACLANDSVIVHVNPLIANAGSDKINICGDTSQMDSVITNYNGNGLLTYTWHPIIGLNSSTIPKPYTTSTGITYTVTVNSTNGCIAKDSISINSIPMNNPNICIVGVDSTNKNMIIWNKPYSTAIDSFLIYEETNVTGIYEKIGAVSYDSNSVFVDYLSNPNIQSSKYKIAILDSCGLVSNQSAYHKTMHLAINQGVGTSWNLIWDSYEGFTVSTYKIYRGTNQNNLQLIGSTSGGNNQYTDFSAPAGYVYYQVEVISPNSCSITKSINSTRSNIATNNPTVINESSKRRLTYSIYPNPSHNEFTIESNGINERINYEIYNLFGQIVSKGKFLEKTIVQTTNLTPGIYLIKLENGKTFEFKKVIKE